MSRIRTASLFVTFGIIASLVFGACSDDDDGEDNGTGGSGASAGAGGTDASAGGAPGCKDIGVTCAANEDCCSSLCDPELAVCAKNPGACRSPGEGCNAGPDCCSFSCVGGKCSSSQCVADNGACSDDGECCGGSCSSGSCAPINPNCKSSGNPCSAAGECCSKYCTDGKCSPSPSFCTQTGDTCTIDTECCAGKCNKQGGATLGTCVVAPASGAGGCLTAGEVCSDGAIYTGGPLPTCGGACCSRACLPYAATGVLICQPPSGCHPTGELCKSDVDCCGSATLPDGKSANVTCSKSAENPIGRCNAGNACTPAGGICRLQTMSCNENANCCAGNVLQKNTCKQDNLGIPRCLAAEIDCTDPSGYVGKACSSSADCCNLPCVPNPNGDPPMVCGSACVPAGGTCTTTADCCAGLPCVTQPGSTTGICGDLPKEDAGIPCAAYGQACTTASDCCNGVPCTDGFCVYITPA